MNTQAIAALELALELIEDAMTNHIYDVDAGELPEEDCGYLQGYRKIKASLDALKAQA